MIRFIPIEVECYSGYKADEYPKYFYLDDKKFEIKEITDRWYQGKSDPEFPVSNYFKTKTESGEIFIIKHDLEQDKWFLRRSE
jgi:hypothetical protein